MNAAIETLKTYDWGGDRGALMGIDEQIKAAQGDTEKLAPIEEALLGVLQPEAKVPAKEYICRKLALIGTPRCIPALAAMLPDPDLSDRALIALQAIPDAAAEEALLSALDNTSGIQRIGVVNALGERRDSKAADKLKALQTSEDPLLTNAVAAALRKIETAGSAA